MSGLDISVRNKGAFIPEDRSWLGDVDGTQATRSITLATSLFTKATHFPNGVLKSGTVLAKVTSVGATQGMYGPYSDAASDGRQTAAGFLWNSVAMETGGPNIAAPLQERGVVIPAKLPTNHGLDTNGRADLKLFIFRD